MVFALLWVFRKQSFSLLFTTFPETNLLKVKTICPIHLLPNEKKNKNLKWRSTEILICKNYFSINICCHIKKLLKIKIFNVKLFLEILKILKNYK